jgi:hypothetical protein
MTLELDPARVPISYADAIDEIQRLRRRLLKQTELTGAAVAVLSAIHRAGGWHVADPQHQERLRAALDALEAATVAVVDGTEP